MQFVIFENAFTFSHWCHYTFAVIVSWCYIITWEWWFCMHFIHAEDFSLSTKSYFMHIVPWSNGASAFSVLILTFPSVTVVYSVVFLWFYLFLCITAPNPSRQTSYIILPKNVICWSMGPSRWVVSKKKALGQSLSM